MKKKVVVKPEPMYKTLKKKPHRDKTKKNETTGKKLETPMQKTKTVYVNRPGRTERTLMLLARILKSLLAFVEKKIQKLRAKRLAERMDGTRNDL